MAVWLRCLRRPAVFKRRFATIPQTPLGQPVRLKVGDDIKMTRSFTERDVSHFAALSLDRNPVHLDQDVASQTRFGHRIVHGILTASLVSACFGNTLPGCIYLSQDLKFLAPVYFGQQITCKIEVLDIQRKRVTCSTDCTNSDGGTVIAGKAQVYIPTLVQDNETTT